MTSTSTIEHQRYCLPRPGEQEPRTETFTAERYGPDGTVTSRPTVERCIECGAQTVT